MKTMPRLPTAAPRRIRVTGFTLIEVLIAALILAVGLLGLAGLHIQTMRLNHSAYLRSHATNFAYDMVDRMRANRNAGRDGAYDIALGAAPPVDGTVAAGDLADWKAALAVTLPAGDGAVQRAGAAVTVTIQWDDTRGTEAAQAFTMTTRL